MLRKFESGNWVPIEEFVNYNGPFIAFQHIVEDIDDMDNYWIAEFFDGELDCDAPEPTHGTPFRLYWEVKSNGD